jgi:hypothetical protein
VQHTTTVNANQAVVTDSVVTGKKNEAAPSAKLLAAVTDKPMEIIKAENQNEAVPVGGATRKRNDHQPHAQGPCRTPVHGQVKANGSALSCACGAGLAGVSDARCPRWRTRGQAEWELPTRCPLEGND